MTRPDPLSAIALMANSPVSQTPQQSIKSLDNPNYSPIATDQNEHTDSTINAVQDTMALMKGKKSAHKFVNGLIPIILLPFVLLIPGAPAFLCVLFHPPDSAQCNILVLIASYDNTLISLVATISPLVAIWRDPELHSPILNWLNQWRRRY